MTGSLALDIIVALAPAPLLLLVFAWLDVFRLTSRGEVAMLLGLGAVTALLAYPVSGRLLDTLPIGFSGYSRFVAPWIEEALKGIAVLGLFYWNRIGFKLDAVIAGFAVGVGFAVIENSLFLFEFSSRMSFGVWLVRGLGTAIMHGGATALFAVVSHEMTENGARARAHQWRLQPLRYLPGLLIAGIVHTIFNQFPENPLLAMMGALVLVPVSLFLVFHFGEVESRAWLDKDHDAHRVYLEALRRDGFQSAEAGPLRAALATRFHGRVADDLVQEYVELHTALVLRAEEVLRQHAAGEPAPISDVDRAGLTRLKDLRKMLGKAVLAALAPALPFSRNDLWELREFEEDACRE
jgi:RsiW-degrading membrane proteinase PrsW (M82 family)